MSVLHSRSAEAPVRPASPPPPEARTREAGIDAFRAIGALGVIHLHFGAFRGAEWEDTTFGAWSVAASFLARMAVPFFFVTSGYFLARRGDPGTLGNTARAQSRRIFFLFASWSLIALAFRGLLRAMNHRSMDALIEPGRRFLDEVLARPVDTLLRGTEQHLWFLPALIFGLMLYVAFDQTPRWRATRPFVAAIVGILGLAVGSYGLMEWPIDLNPRSGPFLSFPLVTIGAWCARRPRMSRTAALAGLAMGFGVTAVEGLWLLKSRGDSPVSHDALIGFFIAGPFLLAIARHASGPVISAAAWVGRLTLGVYACHTLVAVVVLDALRRMGPRADGSALAEVCAFVFIAVVSISLSWTLSLRAGTRRLVQ